MLLPVTCPSCGRPGGAPCRSCVASLRRPRDARRVTGVDLLVAAFDHTGAAAALVTGVKYRNARRVVPWLGQVLAGLVSEPVGCVTWVPASAARRRRGGFDHAELLARATARQLRTPVRRLLLRRDPTPQTGRTRRERLDGVRLVGARRAAAAGTVLLIDDVITTGTTIAEAARVVRTLGADRVLAAVVTDRAPSPGSPARPIEYNQPQMHKKREVPTSWTS